MRHVSVVVLLAVFGIALAQNGPYTNKYDTVDIDGILKNNRVLTNYIKCLMDEGPCTPEGRELKKTLPDALASGCSKCSENQRATTDKVIRHLMNKRVKEWERLTKKYDPQGIYKQKYQQELAATKTA